MEELAAEAGVSTGLLYYHFKDRSTLLRRTLEFVNERAGAYTDEPTPAGSSPRERLERKLLLELQDRPKVVENSKAWGELRASALFEQELQDVLLVSTQGWNDEIAELITQVQDTGGEVDQELCAAAAARLTTMVEGLSQRWLSGSMSLSDAQDLLRGGIELELAGLRGALPAA
jgi:AcrR family transcriptional regulator